MSTERMMHDEIRSLQSITLRQEWRALVNALRAYAHVIAFEGAPEEGGEGRIRIACEEDDLHIIDKLVMGSAVVDPLYRTDQERGLHEIVVRFRRWWREPVPFLMDPDDARHNYRYEAIEAVQRPGSA